MRTQKTVDGVTTEYYTVGGKLLAEKTGDQVLTFHYDEKGTPYALELNGTRYYYRYSLQGDVIGLYSTTGAVVAEYTYDPWGKLLSVTDTSGTDIGTINPLRYRGYYYDTETGFYFLQSRYYDPTVGRFINADDMLGGNGDIQSYNLFAYCSNDPINHSDPSGTVVDLVFEAGVVAIVIIVVGLIVIATAAISLPASPSVAIPGSNDVLDGLRRSLGNVRDGIIEGIAKAKRGLKNLAKSIADDYVDARDIDSNNRKAQYWSAIIVHNMVTPVDPLTYSEARDWIDRGGNLLCINRAAAFAIIRFYSPAEYEGAHRGGICGYLNHYHLSSAHQNHIWFYGD